MKTTEKHNLICQTLAVVGVGLLGGSIAAAVKRLGLAQRVLGVGRNAQRLKQAQELGLLDDFSTELAEAGREAELVVVCTPVDKIVAHVKAVACGAAERSNSLTTGSSPENLSENRSWPDTNAEAIGVLITDVGSVKTDICRPLQGQLPSGAVFVGSHPLAGSEKSGFEYAQAELFSGAVCCVTPTEETPKPAVQRVCEFWRRLGMCVELLSPEEHDRVVARTSHLPHVVAAAVARLVTERDGRFAATGFASTTRVASGDPELWRPILLGNAEAVAAELERLIVGLNDFREALTNKDVDTLVRLLAEGKQQREQVVQQQRRNTK